MVLKNAYVQSEPYWCCLIRMDWHCRRLHVEGSKQVKGDPL
jgi:hypothetical protein